MGGWVEKWGLKLISTQVVVEVEVGGLDDVQILFRVGGWLEKWGLKLISTQVVVEVEVGVELGNIHQLLAPFVLTFSYVLLLSRYCFSAIQL